MRIAFSRWVVTLTAVVLWACEGQSARADVEWQPFRAAALRLASALELLGSPLAEADLQRIAAVDRDPREQIRDIQSALDPLCLATIEINAESRVKATRGAAPAKLVEQGWRTFLIKVLNHAPVTAPLRITSPQAQPIVIRSSGKPAPTSSLTSAEIANRWCEVQTFDNSPLEKNLSGLAIEYRIVEIHSRDSGKREATLAFDVGQGTQDLSGRNEISVLFDCQPAVVVEFGVLDESGQPAAASLVIRDSRGRLHPAPTRRLAPDLFFQEQIYRADGESVRLPAGEYEVTIGRGPEYRHSTRKIVVPAAPRHRESFRLERWIKLVDHGWYSGDHHVHAAGCAHYESPTEGVRPRDMMRQISGEDLNVGCVLSWGPCWYFQKQFFQGSTSELSTARNLLRYDVEVSGFPSSHAGHLCLLGLREDDYPGTTRIEEWPSWDLPVLAWARSQGAVVGFAHSGWGLEVKADRLPTSAMPRFDGIGANEYIVDATHGMCDFISAVDTPAIWELNIWYHTLNCGLTTRISGETDFPCIYGERVGLGRSYVRLLPGERLTYENWLRGLKDGRSYVSDGLSHLFDFRVDTLEVGALGAGNRPSAMTTNAGSELTITAKVAALLEGTPRNDIREKRLDERPYWHLERARLADSSQVPVELIVNGRALERQNITADGSIQPVRFHFAPSASSWVALRVFPSSHTNPIFVEIDGKPARPGRSSAEWCLQAVDVCWKQKVAQIRPEERAAAEAAYEHARRYYRGVLAASAAD